MYVRLILGVALVLMAALGPYFGVPRVVPHQGAARSPDGPPDQRAHARAATVLVLRVGAAVLGAILIVLSCSQLLQGHGSLRPQDTHPAAAH